MNYKSKELRYLTQRGYLKQLTHPEELDKLFCEQKKITFYIGFDCTAKSLHAGHLIPIMIARYLTKMGHKAIIILGTTTAKIGDPSGKNEQRKILSEEVIEENFQSISKIIKKFVKGDAIFLKNDWLEEMGLVEFLRNYGMHFSVNRMVHVETFAERLKNQKPLSFLEFSYSLFQAYDFVHLAKKYNCQLQIGGSDQWGNIVAGLDLGQKTCPEKNLYGATVNLLLNSSGEKMGKTVGGALWLDEEMLSPFDYWQYFRNVDDNDVIKLMNMLTDLEEEEMQYININEAKIVLATKVTEICHNREIADQVAQEAKDKFSASNNIDNLKIDFEIQAQEIGIIDLIKKICPEQSSSQIKTLIAQNAIKLNHIIINDIKYVVNEKDKSILEIGKKKKFVIAWV